jgi:hypothetical protein
MKNIDKEKLKKIETIVRKMEVKNSNVSDWYTSQVLEEFIDEFKEVLSTTSNEKGVL